tara:strand:- start:47 stop:820 length:774 start_codon:yes stop_codon:yes gene_type:complete
MALNINGTTGISGVDGSASAPAVTGTDSNTGINFASDTVNINTGGSTRATIDSAGALDVPTDFPLKVNGSEKLRIDSSGIFMVGKTSSSSTSEGCELRAGASGTGFAMTATSNGNTVLALNRTSSDGELVRFRQDGSTEGSISVSGSTVSYNTSSDYRLKENVVAISDGITRLKTLKPSRFNFKVDKDTTVDGFLAHEVTAVPEATTGTKDEVDSDNNPVYQGIDQSKLVPLLTAALQEAIAKIEVLETKVAALEAG